MKQLLIFLAASAIFSAKGQIFSKDSVSPIFGQAYSFTFPGAGLPDVDTIKVIFLVGCGNRQHLSERTMRHRDDYKPVGGSLFFTEVFQIPGYLARKKKRDNYNESFWMENVAYLDENKQFLPATTIIWLIKEVQ